MLSDDHLKRLRDEAVRTARASSDESLRKLLPETVRAHDEAPPGDDRTELGIMARALQDELARRNQGK